MAKSCSFDVVSPVDFSEIRNAINQAEMEVRQRFDFKGTKTEFELEEKNHQLTLISDDDHKLNSVVDILNGKLIKRGVSLKALDYGKVEPAAGGTVRQVAKIQDGIPQDKGKEIVKFIKGLKVKVQGQVMDDQVRVTGKNRDDLQEVIAELKTKDFGVAITFGNYR